MIVTWIRDYRGQIPIRSQEQEEAVEELDVPQGKQAKKVNAPKKKGKRGGKRNSPAIGKDGSKRLRKV